MTKYHVEFLGPLGKELTRMGGGDGVGCRR